MHEYFSDVDLSRRFAVSRVTVWRWSRTGDFPKPVRLGPNCTRWARDAVELWEATRIADRGDVA